MERAETFALASVGAAQGLFEHYLRERVTARRTWALIGATVLAHEVLCPPGELLSEGADRLIERHPVLVPAGILAVALHLANAIPERYDLLHQGFKIIKP